MAGVTLCFSVCYIAIYCFEKFKVLKWINLAAFTILAIVYIGNILFLLYPALKKI